MLFGHISAGSWVPTNMEAWLRVYGALGFDTAVVNLSSHDAEDPPTFAPLSAQTHSQETPLFALQEAVTRYFPCFLPDILGKFESDLEIPLGPMNMAKGYAAVVDRINPVQATGLRLCLAQHQSRIEFATGPDEGWALLGRIFAARGVPIVQLSEWISPSVSQDSRFRDDIHLNNTGQRALSKALLVCAARAVTVQ